MNISEIIKKVVKQYLNENLNEFEAYGLQPQQVANPEFLKQQVFQYMSTFPNNTTDYILKYEQMNYNQKRFIGNISACVGPECEKVINFYYNAIVKRMSYMDIGVTPEDLTQDFLIKILPRAIGLFVNKNKDISGTKIFNYIKMAAKNYTINKIDKIFKAPDSPKRSDLPLPGTDNSVTFNNAFNDNGENVLQNILNDVKLSNQERSVLTAIMNVVGTADPNIFDEMLNLSDKQKVMRLYSEISAKTGVPTKKVSSVIWSIRDKVSKTKYGNQYDLMDVNKIQPENPQPTPPPTTPPAASNPITRVNQASKIKPTQYNPTTSTDGKNWIYNTNVSESRNNKKTNNRRNMKQKIQISEATLKRMIVRALNEAINKEDALINWANAVASGKNPLNCAEFSRFYENIVSDYRCLEAVKLGVAQENASQTGSGYNDDDDMDVDTNNSKPSIVVNNLFKSSGVGQDILQDFFCGVKYSKKDTSFDDSFFGSFKYYPDPTDRENYEIRETIPTCVNLLLNGKTNEFFTFLCRVLNTYGRHYYRDHYKEWVMQYGKGTTQIGGDKSNAVQDDYTGKEIETDEPTEYDTAALNGSNENKYFEKMIALVEKILADTTIGLGPQERKLLQCLVDISKSPIDADRLNRMQGLSDTQQNQEIYQEMSERTGLPVDKIKRSLSAAIQKAKQSKYAKMLEEKKKTMREKIINEVMRRIMNK